MRRAGSSGIELARLYYTEAVAPILKAHFPGVLHSAGLIGPGSEVLGFDDEMSRDHNGETRSGHHRTSTCPGFAVSRAAVLGHPR
jgi:hypothetical protein